MRRAVAEAKFYRAWAYVELVTLWGTAPLVDHLLAPSEYHVSNSTPEALWAFVEQNLEEAISSGALPSKGIASLWLNFVAAAESSFIWTTMEKKMDKTKKKKKTRRQKT